jgi:hypothetical protein
MLAAPARSSRADRVPRQRRAGQGGNLHSRAFLRTRGFERFPAGFLQFLQRVGRLRRAGVSGVSGADRASGRRGTGLAAERAGVGPGSGPFAAWSPLAELPAQHFELGPLRRRQGTFSDGRAVFRQFLRDPLDVQTSRARSARASRSASRRCLRSRWGGLTARCGLLGAPTCARRRAGRSCLRRRWCGGRARS